MHVITRTTAAVALSGSLVAAAGAASAETLWTHRSAVYPTIAACVSTRAGVIDRVTSGGGTIRYAGSCYGSASQWSYGSVRYLAPRALLPGDS
ncbi:hypothetical protein G9U51_15650 [Calidifontibacter sp. DB0510]|uniref:Uncharacterized protein n=1 Tax=Metallococcus carri TaxID=1656884 RepID=A0A967B9A8_9MICO|nr:hypothetical protein [Metallococcus carri]NHN57206.1 hypothetical protein [Metallococcus carri]NOP37991.1 hypothetical protein [Calidifontibacter sp. DB2511S]